MLFRHKSRRQRMAASLRHHVPTRRMVAVVAGAAALTMANARVSSARKSSS
jgi:hypothetical protein